MFNRRTYYVLVHLILASVLCVSACFYINSSSTPKNLKQGTLIVHTAQGKTQFHVDIADTAPARAQGLMHRTHLGANEGILFVFEKDNKHKFWMKNTPISLDILFFDKNYIVVDIITDTKPNSIETITPRANCLYALEVMAKTAEKYHIKIGDKSYLQ